MSVNEQLEAHWNEHDGIDEKWNVMKSALCKAAETELGVVDNLTGLEIVLLR